MVEVANPRRLVDTQQRVLLLVVVIAALVAGLWAMAGIDEGLRAHPAVLAAWRAAIVLMVVVVGLWIVAALWSRLRQTGPQTEREASFTAFSDTSRGLGRAVLLNLIFSLIYLQVSLSVLAAWLSLIDRHAWLKVLAATPLLLVLVAMVIAPFPALLRDWRSRRVAGSA